MKVLQVPAKQPKRGRLWRNDGTGVRMLTVMDEYSGACLAVRAARSIGFADVIEVLAELMATREMPYPIRSDKGLEFTARAVREWLGRVGVSTLYIEPGSPWENGYIESVNGKLRDDLLDRELFYTLLEVRVLTERYRRTYNQVRPHSSLGYRSPTPEALMPADPVPVLAGLTYGLYKYRGQVSAKQEYAPLKPRQRLFGRLVTTELVILEFREAILINTDRPQISSRSRDLYHSSEQNLETQLNVHGGHKIARIVWQNKKAGLDAFRTSINDAMNHFDEHVLD